MRFAASILVMSLAGCSLATSFDRDRITDGGGLDAARDAEIDGGGGPCDPTTHAGCAPDELCCAADPDPSCQRVGAAQCEACGERCDASASDGCGERVCLCGAAPACAGDTPFCEAGACVTCRDSEDCEGAQCVDGACVECDPSDGSGCGATTPICDGATSSCRACATDPDDCPVGLVCQPSGACGGCVPASHEGCSTPTTPICDGATTICRGCESNDECQAARGLPFCLSDGRCGACRTSTHQGCEGSTPVCRREGGGAMCTACMASSECATRTETPVCATGGPNEGACVECDAGDDSACGEATPHCDVETNACVTCLGPSDCGGTSPICEAGACRACMTGECGDATCVTDGALAGACGECDPGATGTCGAATPICDATSATCRICATTPECQAIDAESVCTGSGRCAGCDPSASACEGTTPICDVTDLVCRACANDPECDALESDTICRGGACVTPECDSTAEPTGCPAERPFCVDSLCLQCMGDGVAGGCTDAEFACEEGRCICRPSGGGQPDCRCPAASNRCSAGEHCDGTTCD